MKVQRGIVGCALIAVLALSACNKGEKVPKLMNLTSRTRSPDEFSILPTKALSMPIDLTSLPTPTPNGTNITDPTPLAAALAALGGKPDALTPANGVGHVGAFVDDVQAVQANGSPRAGGSPGRGGGRS